MRGTTLAVLARLVRFVVVVPLTALTLHAVRPEIPWWSWCGISGLSLLVFWFLDGCVAYARRHTRRNGPSGLRSAGDR